VPCDKAQPMAGKPDFRGGPGIDWSGATLLRMGPQHAPTPFPVPLGGVAAVRRTPGEADDLRMSSSLGLKMTRSTLYPPFSRIEDGHDSGKYGEWSLRGQSWDRSHAQAKTFDPRYPQRSPSTSFERVQYHTTCSPPPLGWRVAPRSVIVTHAGVCGENFAAPRRMASCPTLLAPI